MRKQSDPLVTDKVKARFWGKVETSGPNDCWLWKGRRTAQGYGQIWMGEQTRAYGAHRLSLLIDGQPSMGRIAMHSCDNPACVNPNHLSWGTYQANALDKFSKGRGVDRRGALHPMARLSENDVRAIRKSTESRVELAAKYGTSPDNITQIKSRRRWAHVEDLRREGEAA